jgi:hypothetical protein
MFWKDAGSALKGEGPAAGRNKAESPAGNRAIHWSKADSKQFRLRAECQGKMEKAGHPLDGSRKFDSKRRVGQRFAADRSC